ncbi:MAG: hypothetical protein ACLTR6_05690 [Clostridium fessum]
MRAALPVTQMEKWLSDTEMPDGVCMLSMTRKILEEGRKEGFDIGYLKGLMAAQSKNEALKWRGSENMGHQDNAGKFIAFIFAAPPGSHWHETG